LGRAVAVGAVVIRRLRVTPLRAFRRLSGVVIKRPAQSHEGSSRRVRQDPTRHTECSPHDSRPDRAWLWACHVGRVLSGRSPMFLETNQPGWIVWGSSKVGFRKPGGRRVFNIFPQKQLLPPEVVPRFVGGTILVRDGSAGGKRTHRRNRRRSFVSNSNCGAF